MRASRRRLASSTDLAHHLPLSVPAEDPLGPSPTHGRLVTELVNNSTGPGDQKNTSSNAEPRPPSRLPPLGDSLISIKHPFLAPAFGEGAAPAELQRFYLILRATIASTAQYKTSCLFREPRWYRAPVRALASCSERGQQGKVCGGITCRLLPSL